MDFDALTLLIETTTAGSLAEAARRLRLSPMKATRLISGLEEELGVRLLHRTTRALSLTDDGLAFLPHAKVLLDERAAALASVQGAGVQPTGLLRLSASLAFGRQVAAPLVVDFMRAWPQVQVDLKLTDTVIDIVADGIDLAIRIAELRDSDLIARRVADNPRLLVASPAYIEQFGAPASLSDLSRHECLTNTAMAHWSFRSQGRSRVIKVGGRFTANSIDAIHEACRGGLGIGYLSRWDVAADLANGALREISLGDAAPEPLAIWAVYPSRHMVPAKVKFFIDALAERLKSAGYLSASSNR
ncbi:LysR family transcriptional regulator [Ensifer adhaerens]|uniref:LysR family transcriptional regulator n=1 Tax=Ensifer adhaerens TaxID=106592 RepID=UPI000CF1236E|nr:LysR family transcriptional regulator [Ensifer adhaerens]